MKIIRSSWCLDNLTSPVEKLPVFYCIIMCWSPPKKARMLVSYLRREVYSVIPVAMMGARLYHQFFNCSICNIWQNPQVVDSCGRHGHDPFISLFIQAIPRHVTLVEGLIRVLLNLIYQGYWCIFTLVEGRSWWYKQGALLLSETVTCTYIISVCTPVFYQNTECSIYVCK